MGQAEIEVEQRVLHKKIKDQPHLTVLTKGRLEHRRYDSCSIIWLSRCTTVDIDVAASFISPCVISIWTRSCIDGAATLT